MVIFDEDDDLMQTESNYTRTKKDDSDEENPEDMGKKLKVRIVPIKIDKTESD